MQVKRVEETHTKQQADNMWHIRLREQHYNDETSESEHEKKNGTKYNREKMIEEQNNIYLLILCASIS